jgi:hypothetical protein
MAKSTLRSRIVELNQEDDEFTAGESACDWPSDQPEGLGSSIGQPEGNRVAQREVNSGSTDFGTSESKLRQFDVIEIRGEVTKETPAADPSHFFAGMLAAIKDSNRFFQSSV